MQSEPFSPGLEESLALRLVDALVERRSRRFSRGTAIADGQLAFTFRHPPLRLTQLQQLVVLSVAAGKYWLALPPPPRHAQHPLPAQLRGEGEWTHRFFDGALALGQVLLHR